MQYRYNGDDSSLAGWQKNFSSVPGGPSGNGEAVYRSAVDRFASSGGSAIDVGCGLGRFIPTLTKYCEQVVCLDPDPHRSMACWIKHERVGVHVINSTTSKFIERHPGRQFDLVICSQVLQHISHAVCASLLRDVRQLVKPTGSAMISTSHDVEERFFFATENRRPHNREDFDRYADDCENQTAGLPVRKFTKQAFISSISAAGFAVTEWQQFRFPTMEYLPKHATDLGVSQDAAREVGTSQYAVVRPV